MKPQCTRLPSKFISRFQFNNSFLSLPLAWRTQVYLTFRRQVYIDLRCNYVSGQRRVTWKRVNRIVLFVASVGSGICLTSDYNATFFYWQFCSCLWGISTFKHSPHILNPRPAYISCILCHPVWWNIGAWYQETRFINALSFWQFPSLWATMQLYEEPGRVLLTDTWRNAQIRPDIGRLIKQEQCQISL
jgi:hypothetical protein